MYLCIYKIANIKIKTENKISELFNENNKPNIIIVTKPENRASKIDRESLFEPLINVKKQRDKAINKMTANARTPKTPVAAASSNK